MGCAALASRWRRARRACDPGRDLGVLGPVMAPLSQTRGRNHQDSSVGVMQDRMRDAAQHQRLHAPEPSRAQDDHVGVQIGGLGQDHSGDVGVSIHDPRLGDQSGGRGPLHPGGGAIDRCLLDRSVTSPVIAGEADHAHPERAMAGHRLQDRLPDHQHRRLTASHQQPRSIDRRLRVSGPVITDQDHHAAALWQSRGGQQAWLDRSV
jgi:hypothetical protein